MPHRDIAAILIGMALLSACFQEETRRQEAPVTSSTQATEQQAESQRLPQLAATLANSTDPDDRREALYAIADVGDPEDAALIGEALYDSNPDIRLAAVEALTGIEGGISADWLSVALGDPDPRIRRTAVEALGQVGGETSSLLLQQAFGDADESVREAAQQMLEEQALARSEIR